MAALSASIVRRLRSDAREKVIVNGLSGSRRARGFSAASAFFLLAACATASKPPAAETADEPVAPAGPVYVLSDILGAPTEAIDALLGEPALVRREGRGEYRRYGLSACTLIVILYPDDQGVVRAAQVDAAAHRSGEEKPELDDCLAQG